MAMKHYLEGYGGVRRNMPVIAIARFKDVGDAYSRKLATINTENVWWGRSLEVKFTHGAEERIPSVYRLPEGSELEEMKGFIADNGLFVED